MVAAVVSVPVRLASQVVGEGDRELVTESEIGSAEMARSIETSVERDVEKVGGGGVESAARMAESSRVEDHLSQELMSDKPAAGFARELPAKAFVGNIRTHVGVDVEGLAVMEKVVVEV